MANSSGFRRHASGFSLLEVLVVATILVAVIGGAYGLYDKSLDNARFQQMRASQKQLQTAIDQYRARYNRYPASLEALTRRYLNQVPDDPTTRFPGNDWLVRGPTSGPTSVAAWRPATSPPAEGIAEIRSSGEI